MRRTGGPIATEGPSCHPTPARFCGAKLDVTCQLGTAKKKHQQPRPFRSRNGTAARLKNYR